MFGDSGFKNLKAAAVTSAETTETLSLEQSAALSVHPKAYSLLQDVGWASWELLCWDVVMGTRRCSLTRSLAAN